MENHTLMAYDYSQIKRMISDSGMTVKEIEKRSGINRTMIYELQKPENARRITIDKIIKLGKACNLNPVHYFPEIEKEAMHLLEEPVATYNAQKTVREVREYMEDILLRIDTFRDDYINALKYNISMQEQVIEMQKEKISVLTK